MGDAGQDDELAVTVRQLVIEFLKIGDGSNAVILAAHQQHRGQHLLRMHDWQIGGHVEIGAGRNLVAELHLGVCQRLHGGRIGGAGLVAGRDRADHVAVALAHVVGAEIVKLLGPLGQGRRTLALVGEGGEHQAIDAPGRHHGKGAGAQRAGGFAYEVQLLLPGLAGNQFDRNLQILDAAGDIGIAGGAAGLAVILVIHGPAVEAVAGEFVHRGIFAFAGDVEIEYPRRH